MSKQFLAIGECMVEMAPTADGAYQLGFAGDTLNTAWYVARLGKNDVSVSYLTAIGDDDISGKMRDFIYDAGITPKAAVIKGRSVGLYLISLNNGERSFQYWRETSAARRLARDLSAISVLKDGDIAYFSGITLAILVEADRTTLLEALGQAKSRGVCVVFDPNLRPRLWPDIETMCAETTRAAGFADVALPSFEDDADAFGDADKKGTIARYNASGVTLVVAKDGPNKVVAKDGDGPFICVAPQQDLQPIDTTAAGDAFNAAFLLAHLRGEGLKAALEAGCALSALVVSQKGALVPVSTA